jgi:hypothetical protein
MSIPDESIEAATLPGEITAIPWTTVERQHELLQQLDLVIGDDDLSFQDTVFLDDLPYWRCTVRLASLDFGESVNLK